MEINNIIIFSCWAVFLVFWGISALFVKKSTTVNRSWQWRIIAIIILFVIVAAIKFPSLQNAGDYASSRLLPTSTALSWIGSILSVFGVIGAVWSRTALGRNWSGYVTFKEKHELITRGPYRYFRHPIYTFVLIMVLGTFLNFGTVYLLIVLIAITTQFIVRGYQEEKLMFKNFGKKYLEYKKKTIW